MNDVSSQNSANRFETGIVEKKPDKHGKITYYKGVLRIGDKVILSDTAVPEICSERGDLIAYAEGMKLYAERVSHMIGKYYQEEDNQAIRAEIVTKAGQIRDMSNAIARRVGLDPDELTWRP